jgi:hypothetical protein
MIETREAMERARRGGMFTRFLLFFHDRGLEWFSAVIMLGWGLTLVLPGDTLSGPQYAAFGRFGITEDMWALAFGAVGLARLVALYINGRWPRSPYVRMVGSLFGAVSWAQVAYLITESTYFATGIAATGTWIYSALAIADLLGIARAAFDARYHHS